MTRVVTVESERGVGVEGEGGEGRGWEGDWGGGEEEEEEGWATVTEEGERWVRLVQRLEVLTTLCGVVGSTIQHRAPPLPYCPLPRQHLQTRFMNTGKQHIHIHIHVHSHTLLQSTGQKS